MGRVHAPRPDVEPASAPLAAASPLDALGVLDTLGDPVLVIDVDGTIAWANQRAEQRTGWSRADWLGRSVLDLVHPDDLPLVMVSLESMSQRSETGLLIDIRVADASGGWHYYEVRGARAPDGRISIVARDVTDRRSLEMSADDDARFRAMVHYSAALTMLVDATGHVLTANGAVTRLLGLDPEHVTGRLLTDLVADGSSSAFALDLARALLAPKAVIETAFPGPEGGHVHIEFHTVNLLDDPVVRGVILSGHDVTQLVEVRQTLERLENRDALTGLANREALARRLDRLLADPVVASRTAVLFGDLDRFRPVNELFGHEAGDALLVEVANRIRRAVPPDALVARFGADEFVVAVGDVASYGAAASLAARLERSVSGPVQVGRSRVPVRMSVGFALAGGRSAEQVLADADAAMNVVKAERRGLPTPELLPAARRWIADELPRAIERRELVVHYQPIVHAATRRLAGYEALVRWRHPDRGLIPPDGFVAVAEDAGMASALGELVLADAIDLLRRTRADAPGLFVSSNVSSGQLHDPSLADWLARQLRLAGVDPERLWLEITESAALDQGGDLLAASTEASLQALQAVGVRLAVDDFGTGYASLIHLRRLPAHVLKIDRSFVTELATSSADTGIVRSMVVLGQVLGVKVVAEGVEHEDQASVLEALGCDYLQGFHFGAPLPRDTAIEQAAPRHQPRPS
jgi:diguanylate cyclase (GGDEF)-like protein/PAS domain S-box-containing protein